MVSYRLEWKRSAEKDLHKIDRSRIPPIIHGLDN